MFRVDFSPCQNLLSYLSTSSSCCCVTGGADDSWVQDRHCVSSGAILLGSVLGSVGSSDRLLGSDHVSSRLDAVLSRESMRNALDATSQWRLVWRKMPIGTGG